MSTKSSISLLAKTLVEKNGLQQAEAEKFVRLMFDVANQSLLAEKQVKIKGLGTFKIMAVKDRESIDVNTGERIVIEGRDRVVFTPDNILKEIVNKPFAQFETVVVNDGVDFSSLDEKYAEMQRELQQNVSAGESSSPLVPIEQEELIDDVEANSVQDVEQEVALPQEPVSVQEAPVQESAASEEEVQEDSLDERKDSSESVFFSGQQEEDDDEDYDDDVEAKDISMVGRHSLLDSHHVVLPKSIVVFALISFVVLIAGFGLLAFYYGKITAMHEQVVESLELLPPPVSTPAPMLPRDELDMLARLDRPNRVEKQRKDTDSVVMAKPEQEPGQTRKESKVPRLEEETASSLYDNDSRVRTGAYRIVGVAQKHTVKKGQTLSSISRTYLGPGMECYVEVLNNGVSEVKEGQVLKIPKLELKKKKR